jgi:hypothetical protein
MNNIFIIAIVISVIYLIAKFLEMRFILKENKPLSILIRDALFVYFSVVVGYFILEQIKPILQDGGSNAQAFTNNPDF